jgi:NAD(P)-dependent dehydrogenase (short-subunit alcohol dehydrogenase family)
MRLHDEVALVTGAAQGLGAAIAERLAAEGARVAVTDANVDGARREAAAIGDSAIALHLDVRSRASVEEAVAEVEEALGPLTVLVNNAGINRIGPSESLEPELWRQVLEIDLDGVFRCTQVAGARMLARGRGSIVNIASANAEVGSPGRAAYCAAKTGVVGLTRALGVEWAGRGVRVNAVEPGYVHTPLLENCFETGLIDRRRLLDRIPAGRLGDPDDIGRAVCFLASRDAAYVTAQTLAVDGGFLMYGAPAPASEPPCTVVVV